MCLHSVTTQWAIIPSDFKTWRGMKYSFSRWWFRCWSSASVACVTWRGCTWLWGRFCVSHGEVVCDRGGGSACVRCSSMGNVCSTLQFLWTLKCSEKNAILKEKKENKEKKIQWHLSCSWVESSDAGWLYLWICQVNWTCSKSHCVYTTGNCKQPGRTLSAVLVH